MEIIVLILIVLFVRAVLRKKKEMDREEKLAANAVKTYTFNPTGVRFECKFPSGRTSRQGSINRSRAGDPVDLRVYEWQGKPAIAAINRRTGYDIGVASADTDRPALCELMDQYRTEGVIEDITSFRYDGDDWKQAMVKIYCFPKDQA